jgi:predicted dehydrogenase
MRKMRFFQPSAYISVDFLQKSSEVYELIDPNIPPSENGYAISFGKLGGGENAKEIRYSKYEKLDINPLKYELELFINSILNDTPPAVDGREGVRALRVAGEIMNSIDDHAKIIKENWNLTSNL